MKIIQEMCQAHKTRYLHHNRLELTVLF